MCSTINTRRVVARGLQTSQLPQRQPLPVGVLRNRRQARRQMSPQVPRGRPETSPEQEFVHALKLREAHADLPTYAERSSAKPRGCRWPVVLEADRRGPSSRRGCAQKNAAPTYVMSVQRTLMWLVPHWKRWGRRSAPWIAAKRLDARFVGQECEHTGTQIHV